FHSRYNLRFGKSSFFHVFLSLKLTSFFPLTLTKNGQLLGEAYTYSWNTEVKKKTTAQLVDGELQLEDGSRIRYSTEGRRRINGKYTFAYILYEGNFYVKKGSDE
ncbi:MAG: hypothetical protein U9R46_01175, partial [Bacteroidota bacterium]|nr:hypothetical protein [Bacteroidota bacterium]